MIDLSFLLLRSELTTSFTLIEAVGQWVDRKWVISDGQEVTLQGAVSPTSQNDLDRLPETSRLECTTTIWVKGKTNLNIDSGIRVQRILSHKKKTTQTMASQSCMVRN